jgi:hypothetical protein
VGCQSGEANNHVAHWCLARHDTVAMYSSVLLIPNGY